MMFSSQRLLSVSPRLTSAFPKHLNPPQQELCDEPLGGWWGEEGSLMVCVCVFISAPEAKAPGPIHGQLKIRG